MHQFGRHSERGANFFSFLQKEGGGWGVKKKEGFLGVDGVHKRLQLTIKFICNLQDLITIQTCLKILK